MKVLSLGLDNKILDIESNLARRAVDYSTLVDKYSIIVPSKSDSQLCLTPTLSAYGVAGKNKISQLFHIYSLSKVILNSEDFDIITVQDQYYLALVAFILSKKYKLGLEIQVHGLEKFCGIRKCLAKYLIKRATVVRVVSERLKNRMIKEFRVPEENITVVPIFTPTHVIPAKAGIQETTSIHQSPEKDNDKFIFFTASRLVEIKNIALQIKAFSKISKDFPRAELRIAGSGPEEDKLKKLAKDLNLETKIKFLGWQRDLSPLYEEANAFLLTSNYEGWGMVIVEAASYALPIIMTDVGCAGELIKDNKSGLLIPTNDQVTLEKAMTKILQDKSLRQALGQSAQTEALNLPTYDKTLELYKKSWQKAAK